MKTAFAAAALLALAGAAPAFAQDGGGQPDKADAMAQATLVLVDKNRHVKASRGYPGAETRRLDVMLWYPQKGADGPYPLVIYSHGTFGHAANAMHIVRALVDAGYVVAAPEYPLTSRKAYTKVAFADISDVFEQVRDISFLIDALTTHPLYGKLIDRNRIGVTGHSLGAVTSYFAVYGQKTRDPRIRAVAPVAGGDPVQTALDNPMGLDGAGHASVHVPALFLQGDKDVFARMTGRPYAAFARVEGPKYQLLVKGGYHIAFRDGDERHPLGKNPDCLFFEEFMPGTTVPGCEEPGAFIDPARQQQVTRAALVTFFDAHLKDDAAALERLRGLGDDDDDLRMVYEDGAAD